MQQRFDKEQSIFRSGDIFNGIYAILEGAVRLGYIDIHGKESVAAIVEPIMWFGEISLVDAQPRSHDAIATQKSLILHIPSTAPTILQQHPVFWYHIAQLTSQKLRFAFGADFHSNAKHQPAFGTTPDVYFKWLWQSFKY